MPGPAPLYRPPGSRLDPGYQRTIPSTLPTPGPGQVAGVPPDASDGGHPRPQKAPPPAALVLERELAARIECRDWAGLLAFGLTHLCECLVAKLHATQIGARLSGHVVAPPGSIGLFATGGIDDATPVSLAAGGAWTTVASVQVQPGRVGVIRSLGVAVADAFFWPLVQWRLLRGNVAVMGPWFGQFGTINQPHVVGPFTGAQRETFYLQGSNGSGAAAVNAQAVLEGWQFVSLETPDQPWRAYLRDQG